MIKSNKLIKIKKVRSPKAGLQNKTENVKNDNSVSINPLQKAVHSNNKMKFRDAVELWNKYTKIHLKGATYLKYYNLIQKHILPELGDLYIEQINSVLLAEFMSRKLTVGRLDNKGGLSVSYVKSIMVIITEIIKFSIDEGYCPPVKTKFHMPRNEKNQLCVLDKETQLFLENYIISNLTETNFGILLSLNTGMRIGEICALKWSDIDLDNAILYVNSTVSRIKCEEGSRSVSQLVIDKPKTKSSIREIPLVSRILEPLMILYKQRNSEYVISSGASFVSPRTFEYRFHTVLKKCGIPSVNFHALRHTFATRCIEYGVDVKSLSEILGHANVSITLNTYVHSSIERKRALMEKIAFATDDANNDIE